MKEKTYLTAPAALQKALDGGIIKREIIKNDTVIKFYKDKLYQVSMKTGVRYPYVLTNEDLVAKDWHQEIEFENDTKESFYTKEFYENPITTLDIFNKLVKERQVSVKDMYESGEFLFMEVFENEKTKEILSPIISDLEKYKKHNNSNYISNNSNRIVLCALQEDHEEHFGKEDEIMWESEEERFVSAAMMWNEDEEY